MRWIIVAALGAAFGLALTMPMGNEAEARRKAKVTKSSAKMCTGTTFEGNKVSFRCKASERCCFDGLMAKGNCVPTSQQCF